MVMPPAASKGQSWREAETTAEQLMARLEARSVPGDKMFTSHIIVGGCLCYVLKFHTWHACV